MAELRQIVMAMIAGVGGSPRRSSEASWPRCDRFIDACIQASAVVVCQGQKIATTERGA